MNFWTLINHRCIYGKPIFSATFSPCKSWVGVINNCVMESFKTFVEEQEFVEFVVREFNGAPIQGGKPWSAKKPEILQMWRNLRHDMPIYMTPMHKSNGHQSYGEDGIRVTGSWQFISAVLGRLKELLAYENPHSKLRLVFRGVDRTHGNPNKLSYVFYVNLENRGSGKNPPEAPQPKI
jgi:hypothetical protein